MDDSYVSKLEKRNIKPTAMRLLVFEVLYKSKQALSLYDIEQIIDHAERSTIFRSLKTFQDKFLIHSIDDGTGAIKYALCDDSCSCTIEELHVHFLCRKCQKTNCLSQMPIPTINTPQGFVFEDANFVIKGVCKACH